MTLIAFLVGLWLGLLCMTAFVGWCVWTGRVAIVDRTAK